MKKFLILTIMLSTLSAFAQSSSEPKIVEIVRGKITKTASNLTDSELLVLEKEAIKKAKEKCQSFGVADVDIIDSEAFNMDNQVEATAKVECTVW